jgi:hypothetical protein
VADERIMDTVTEGIPGTARTSMWWHGFACGFTVLTQMEFHSRLLVVWYALEAGIPTDCEWEFPFFENASVRTTNKMRWEVTRVA